MLSIFLSDLKVGIKSNLIKFANDINLSCEVDILAGRATLQEDLDRLNEQGNQTLVILHLEKYNPGLQNRLGSTWPWKGSGGQQARMSELCDDVGRKPMGCWAASTRA